MTLTLLDSLAAGTSDAARLLLAIFAIIVVAAVLGLIAIVGRSTPHRQLGLTTQSRRPHPHRRCDYAGGWFGTPYISATDPTLTGDGGASYHAGHSAPHGSDCGSDIGGGGCGGDTSGSDGSGGGCDGGGGGGGGSGGDGGGGCGGGD